MRIVSQRADRLLVHADHLADRPVLRPQRAERILRARGPALPDFPQESNNTGINAKVKREGQQDRSGGEGSGLREKCINDLTEEQQAAVRVSAGHEGRNLRTSFFPETEPRYSIPSVDPAWDYPTGGASQTKMTLSLAEVNQPKVATANHPAAPPPKLDVTTNAEQDKREGQQDRSGEGTALILKSYNYIYRLTQTDGMLDVQKYQPRRNLKGGPPTLPRR